MNWARLRHAPWLDTRAKFVARTPPGGGLLDLGSSDGHTLRHFAELRPDLHFFAVDTAGQPENSPAGCHFHRGDLQRDKLPWPDASIDAITCMHLVEHLDDQRLLFQETERLLKPGGQIYLETPHPKSLTLSSPPARKAIAATVNFYDDLTHVKPVPVGALAQWARRAGLEVVASGVSRNWLIAGAYPLFLFLPASRKKYVAYIHWIGWSAYLIAQRPACA